MALAVRNTNGPQHRFDIWSVLLTMWYSFYFSTRGDTAGAIVGTVTAGELDAAADVTAHIAGVPFTFDQDGTDASWDLSEEEDLEAGEYRAYWLYSTATSVASIEAGALSASPEDALRNLPNPDVEKAILGVYVAGDDENAIDFDSDTLGADGYGTVYNGIPEGANIGVEGGTAVDPQLVTVTYS